MEQKSQQAKDDTQANIAARLGVAECTVSRWLDTGRNLHMQDVSILDARLGVAQNTVSVWFGHNIKDDNMSVPDARVKVAAGMSHPTKCPISASL
jgi:hypothetical protein